VRKIPAREIKNLLGIWTLMIASFKTYKKPKKGTNKFTAIGGLV
jgi:hypothetical protein